MPIAKSKYTDDVPKFFKIELDSVKLFFYLNMYKQNSFIKQVYGI